MGSSPTDAPMFEKLIIQNFQAQRSLSLDLDPYVTCLVGESDVGKSSILRALYWLCLNRPSGDEFRSWGTNKTRVTLQIDGQRVTRVRGKRNIYKLNGEELEAFAQQVPEEVQKLLRVDHNNFQTQLELAFWFALSPGNVSRELNRIVNLDIIDSSLSKCASQLRLAKTRVLVTEERLEAATKELESMAWVEEADQLWERVEVIEGKIERSTNLLSSLNTVLGRLHELRVARDKAAAAKSVIERASRYYQQKILGLEEQVQSLENRIRELHKIIRKLEQHGAERCRKQKQLRELLDQIEEEKKRKKNCPTCGRPLP